MVDARRAVVAQASVTAINVDTSLTYRAESNSSGEWAISPVRIGSYRIQITAKGFKASIEGPLTLDVQQRQRVDVTLEPGEVTEILLTSTARFIAFPATCLRTMPRRKIAGCPT